MSMPLQRKLQLELQTLALSLEPPEYNPVFLC
jgi:hypothetical protein